MSSVCCRIVAGGPVLAAVAVAWLAAPVASQADAAPVADGAGHQVAVELAGLAQGLDDRMASPLRYKGLGPAVGAAYEGRAGRWRWSLRAAGGTPRLTAAGSAGEEETAWFGGAAYLVRGLWRPAPWLEVAAGPGLTADVRVRRHTYAEGVWLNFRDAFAAFQAVGFAGLDLGRYGAVTASVGVPLAGVAVRKEYAGVVDRPPRIVVGVPPSFVLWRQRLGYAVPLDGALTARLFHEMTLVRHDQPDRLSAVSHRTGFGASWRWGRR